MASTSAALGSAGEREGLAAEETLLARKAAGGDGAAFATLYDRYESRIFNFCSRLLASPDDAADATQDAFLKVLQRLPKISDRELNFSAYLYTAARNASYDMIGKRKRATPVDEIPEHGGGEGTREPGDLDLDPERTAMLDSAQEEIRAANGRLPERQREVLALRELEDRSYDEIAEIMGMNRNSVAQLISRARIKLRDELRGTALASIAVSSADCERALPLIAARADGQLGEGEDATWLAAHLTGCDTCRVSEEAMEEAGTSYRGWLPLVPLLWLRRETIAKAGERVGSDWSQIANSPRPEPGPGPGQGTGGAGNAGADEGEGTGTDGGGNGAGPAANGDSEPGRLKRTLRSKRRAGFVLLGALALLLGVFVAMVVGDDGSPQSPSKTSAPAGSEVGAVISTGADGVTTTIKKPHTDAAGTISTAAAVVTTTLPSGQVTTTTLPSKPKHTASTHKRHSPGGTGKGGGGGVVNLPATSSPTTTDSPPPTTADTPPPTTTTTTTTTTPRCAPAAAGCGGGGGTTTTTAPPPRRCVPTRTTRCP